MLSNRLLEGVKVALVESAFPGMGIIRSCWGGLDAINRVRYVFHDPVLLFYMVFRLLFSLEEAVLKTAVTLL